MTLSGSSAVQAAAFSDVPQAGTVVPRDLEDTTVFSAAPTRITGAAAPAAGIAPLSSSIPASIAPPAKTVTTFDTLAPESAAVPSTAAAMSAAELMDLPLEKLVDVEVTSASKYAQKSSEAPSAVEVLTADDIRTFGYRTLGDALNGLHGLYASSDRNYNYLGVNGFLRPGDYNSRILIMIDGHRMNDNVYDSANTGQEFLLDMNLVDHIEYIPGPGSSIYGANAMEGVVNVITKKGADINGTQVSGGYGSFSTSTARATYGKRLDNGADILLSASNYHSGGQSNLFYPEFDTPETNNGVAHNMDGENSNRLFLRAQYEDFTFTSGYVGRFKQVPIASFDTIFNDSAYHTTDDQAYAELKYNTSLTEQTKLEAKGFYQGYNYHAYFPYDANAGSPPIDRIVNYDATSGRWGGGETDLVSTAFNRQKIVVGAELQYDFQQHVYNYDIDPYTLYQNSHRVGLRSGIFGQDDIKLLQNLVLSTGVRLDQSHMIKNDQINPRLGLIWDPRQDTTVKLLYGSAFRAPNEYERDINTQGNAANPNNQEEHVKNYQSIVEWRPVPGVKLQGSLFDNDFTDFLAQDPVSLQYVNSGHYNSYGYDLEADKRWVNGRDLRASFDHTILYDESGPSDVGAADSPKNVFKLLYAEPLFNDKAKLGIEDVFIDQRKTLQDTVAPSYDLVNVNLTSDKIFSGADISFAIYNLFDVHPEMVGGDGPDVVNDSGIAEKTIALDGLNVMLTLQYTFK